MFQCKSHPKPVCSFSGGCPRVDFFDGRPQHLNTIVLNGKDGASDELIISLSGGDVFVLEASSGIPLCLVRAQTSEDAPDDAAVAFVLLQFNATPDDAGSGSAFVVTAHESGLLRLFRLERGDALAEMSAKLLHSCKSQHSSRSGSSAGAGAVSGLAGGGDSFVSFSALEGSVRLWKVGGTREVAQLSLLGACSTDLSAAAILAQPGAATVVLTVAAEARVVSLWSLASGSEAGKRARGEQRGSGLRIFSKVDCAATHAADLGLVEPFALEGQLYLLTGDASGQVCVFAASTGKVVARIDTEAQATAAHVVVEDSRAFVALGSLAGSVSLFCLSDPGTRGAVALLSTSAPRPPTFSDEDTSSVSAVTNVCAVRRGGGWLAWSGTAGGDVACSDLSGSVAREAKRLAGALDEVISVKHVSVGGSEYLLSASNDAVPRLLSLNSREVAAELRGRHTDMVLHVEASALSDHPSRPVLAMTGSKDRTVGVWLLFPRARGEVGVASLGSLEGHEASVTCVTLLAVRPRSGSDGGAARNLFEYSFSVGSVGEDAALKIWSFDISLSPDLGATNAVAMGAASAVDLQSGHAKCINHVAVSPDGKFLSTSSQDKLCIVWRRREGGKREARKSVGWEVVGKCAGHARGVWASAFEPSGRRVLVSASGDGSLRAWAFTTTAGKEKQSAVEPDIWQTGTNKAKATSSLLDEMVDPSGGGAPSLKTLRVFSRSEHFGRGPASLGGHASKTFSSVHAVKFLAGDDEEFYRVRDSGELVSDLRNPFFQVARFAAAYSDGAVCVWALDSGECLASIPASPASPLAGHAANARLWTVEASADLQRASGAAFVTGGSDGRVFSWVERTAEDWAAKLAELRRQRCADLEIKTLLSERRYNEAIARCFRLNRPKDVLRILETAAWSLHPVEMREWASELLRDPANLEPLLQLCASWLRAGHSAHAAARLLLCLNDSLQHSQLARVEGSNQTAALIKSLAGRHQDRICNHVRRSYTTETISYMARHSA